MKGSIRKTNSKYKVVAIYGSPRIGGNTAILMDYFLKGVVENTGYSKNAVIIDRLLVKEKDISPCRECGNCSKTGECIISDDMQEIYKLLIEADFIAVASPVFFTSVSAYLKAIIDRCQRFWVLKYEHSKNIIKKPRRGIFISTSGSGQADIFNCSIKVIRSFFDVLFVNYLKDFTFNGIDKKGEILNNEKAVWLYMNLVKIWILIMEKGNED